VKGGGPAGRRAISPAGIPRKERGAMNFRTSVFCAIGALLLAGLSWVGPTPRGPREVSATEADGLVGGVACAYYAPTICNLSQEATSGCPTTPCHVGGDEDDLYAKPSPTGTFWCGCVSSCKNLPMIKGLYDFGCGSAGVIAADGG